MARRSGDLVIPAIQFGADSSPITPIKVADHIPGRSNQELDLILELAVDETAPYVQQQVIVTVRLLRRIELSDAKLSEPSANADAIFKVLARDKTYQDRRDDRRYEVFERRYAVYPQASGSMTINPLILTAQVARSTRSFFDPFRSGMSTRRVRSNAVKLEVKPVPDAFTGDVWLPARRLRLRDEWEPASAQVRGRVNR